MPISLYDPRTLSEVVRVLPSTGGFFRDTFFKKRTPIFGAKADVDFYKGKRKVAPFVNPLGSSKAIGKTGYKTNTFETPLLKPKDITTIKDLDVRMPGENVYSTVTREQRAVQMLAEKFVEFNDMIVRREEQMAAAMFFTGKIPIIGEGVSEEIDFEFTNKVALTGTDKWSDTLNSDPLDDIDQFSLSCKKNGYRTPNICVIARDAYTAFKNHPKVKDVLDLKNMEVAIIKPAMLSENVTYGGTIVDKNMSIYIYDEWYMDDWTDPANPVEKPLVPAGTVLLASTNAAFEIYYGEITLIDKETGDFKSVVGERAADTWTQKDPDGRFIALHSRPLPVGHEVDSWYVATVL